MTARMVQKRDGDFQEGERRHCTEVGIKSRMYVYWSLCPTCNTGRWLAKRRIGSMCNQCTIILRSQPLGAEGAKHKRVNPGDKQRGSDNHNWKGGRKPSADGYIFIWVHPSDPYACMVHKGSRYALEHRLVMAKYLGRPLRRYEAVHHRNGDKADNRIENLELWVRPHPSGQRAAEHHCPGCRCFEMTGDQE